MRVRRTFTLMKSLFYSGDVFSKHVTHNECNFHDAVLIYAELQIVLLSL